MTFKTAKERGRGEATASVAVSCTEKADWVLLFCFIFLRSLSLPPPHLRIQGQQREGKVENEKSAMQTTAYSQATVPAKGHSHPALRTSSSTHVPSVYAFHTMAVPVKTESLSSFIDSRCQAAGRLQGHIPWFSQCSSLPPKCLHFYSHFLLKMYSSIYSGPCLLSVQKYMYRIKTVFNCNNSSNRRSLFHCKPGQALSTHQKEEFVVAVTILFFRFG